MECCETRVRVGQEAPLFTTDGYHGKAGEVFGKYSLADYKGKKVLLFFYPGDFTFV